MIISPQSDQPPPPRVIDVTATIETHQVGFRQGIVIFLCALVMLLDGFNTQAISYIVPSLAREWHISRHVLGPIFSAALVGLIVGYLVVAPLSSRFGHKRMMVASTLIFAVFTVLTVFATNVPELIAMRFFTGIGLGAAAPSAVALTCEFSPKRLRATFVLIVYCGFTLGFVLAGLAAGLLIPEPGWKALMIVGAIVPLALAVALGGWLPESLAFLQHGPNSNERIRVVFAGMFPQLDVPAGSTFHIEEGSDARASVASLFRNRWLAVGTILLWLVFFLNLAEFYFIQSWLPTMLTGLKYSPAMVAWITAVPTIAGVLAAVPLGLAMDRIGPFVTLTVIYVAGSVFMWLVGGAFSGNIVWLMAVVFCAGFCVSGGQKSVIALAAIYYPQRLRSTGVGWALGMGRLGGIAGPLVAGMLYSAQQAPGEIFRAAALPILLAGVGVFVMGRFSSERPEPPPTRSTH